MKTSSQELERNSKTCSRSQCFALEETGPFSIIYSLYLMSFVCRDHHDCAMKLLPFRAYEYSTMDERTFILISPCHYSKSWITSIRFSPSSQRTLSPLGSRCHVFLSNTLPFHAAKLIFWMPSRGGGTRRRLPSAKPHCDGPAAAYTFLSRRVGATPFHYSAPSRQGFTAGAKLHALTN